jgi:hypothetical protein
MLSVKDPERSRKEEMNHPMFTVRAASMLNNCCKAEAASLCKGTSLNVEVWGSLFAAAA